MGTMLFSGTYSLSITKRIVDESMCIPGRVEFMDGKLSMEALLEKHPYADDMRLILEELLDLFENCCSQ